VRGSKGAGQGARHRQAPLIGNPPGLEPAPKTEAARIAVALVFGVNGFAFATWASRLPAIRDTFDLSTERLGLLLLFMSVGSVVMLTMAGVVVRLLGPARTVAASGVVSMAGLALLGAAPSVPVLAVALAITGAGIGSWDVAMNVEGADVERRLGRSLMPRFHAAFSLGTVSGAGLGALAALAQVPVAVHLPLVAAAVLPVALLSVRRFLPVRDPGLVSDSGPVSDPGPVSPASGAVRSSRLRGPLEAWRDPATLLIGVLVFSMALAEGAANDWLALSVVDGYGAVHALGAVALGVFVAGMTATRMAGPYLLSRFDNVRVLRVSALLVLAGTALLIAGAEVADGSGSAWGYAVAGLASLLWGLGAALGFPMGMTAASADPAHAAARVAVVSTIGYVAFIAGPPLLGTLGERIGTAQSMVAVSGAVLLALLTAHAVRPTLGASGTSVLR
jgi:fucose permease